MTYYNSRVRRTDIAVTNAVLEDGYAIVALDKFQNGRIWVSLPPRMSLSPGEAEELGEALVGMAGRVKDDYS